MGSNESKTQKEESLCGYNEHRLHFMKAAVSSRNAFFAALTVYGVCLKNTGAAFTDGIHPKSSHLPSPEPVEKEKMELETDESTARVSISNPQQEDTTLQWGCWRKIDENETKPKPLFPTIMEDEELELETQDYQEPRWISETRDPQAKELPTRMHQDTWEYFFPSDLDLEGYITSGSSRQDATMPQESTWDYYFPPHELIEESPMVMPPVQKKLVVDIGRMRMSRRPVSLKHLFSDLDDHFLKAFESNLEVSQMLESNNSNFPNGHCFDQSERAVHLITREKPFKGKDKFDADEVKTLATVLNKMLDLEMNLYDQIKAREVVKCEYQKKVNMLNKQKEKSDNTRSLEKLKVAVSHLYTRYNVEKQSVVSTVAEINRFHDDQLYPKLAQLVDGMATMWKTMLFHHESQFNIVYFLKSSENIEALMENSECRHRCTTQLYGAVCDWYTKFCGLVEYQKDFIRVLHKWLKLSLVPIETNSIENIYPSPRVQRFHLFVTSWKNDLDILPDEVAKNAMINFAAVIRTEMRQEDKQEAGQTISNHLRDTDLASLRHSLPELFRAMSEIAQAFSRMYCNLRSIAEHL